MMKIIGREDQRNIARLVNSATRSMKPKDREFFELKMTEALADHNGQEPAAFIDMIERGLTPDDPH